MKRERVSGWVIGRERESKERRRERDNKRWPTVQEGQKAGRQGRKEENQGEGEKEKRKNRQIIARNAEKKYKGRWKQEMGRKN